MNLCPCCQCEFYLQVYPSRANKCIVKSFGMVCCHDKHPSLMRGHAIDRIKEAGQRDAFAFFPFGTLLGFLAAVDRFQSASHFCSDISRPIGAATLLFITRHWL